MIASRPPCRAEAEVASRFDELEARFKAEADPGDFRFEAALRHLGPIAGRVVLDVGCGKGRFAARLEQRGAEVIGLDVSREMLRSARNVGLAVARGSARRLPFADASVDGVLFIEVLEHVPSADLGLVLTEAVRVLRPGGRVAIVDKNAVSLDPVRPWLPAAAVKRIDEHRGRWMYPPGSIAREHWFWPGQVPRLLRRAGAVDVRSERPLAPGERRWAAFRRVPMARRFAAWSAARPGGLGDGA